MALGLKILRTPIRCMSSGLSSKVTVSDTTSEDDQLYRHLWLRCTAHEPETLDSYETFIKMTAKHLDIPYIRTETPFRNIRRRTLLLSRFVHKKCRAQYETRTYFKNMLFKNLTGSTADTFLEYVERNIPEGVGMIVEKHRIAELPFELKEEPRV